MTSIEQLISARDAAAEKVRAWWDAEALAGRFSDHTQAPAWPEYIAAFNALDAVREAALTPNNQTSEAR